MLSREYYASECYGNFGVFSRVEGQVGGWWPTIALAKQAAELLNTVCNQKRRLQNETE
jgi:hypothetical protein